MSDTGQTITIGDTATLAELIALESDTQGRFGFILDPSGKFATVYYVNYVQPRVKDSNGAFKLQAQVTKKVVISG